MNMAKEKGAVEITFDQRNYRKHSKKNKDLIKKSLEELGAGRSVLLDKENSLIAGNGVFEQAQALGIPVRVIETDGSELIAVKRTDLATEDEKRKKLALADNSASDSSEFNVELLRTDWAADALKEWGVEMPEIDVNKILDDANFESLNDATKVGTGMKEFTFVFSKEEAEVIEAYIVKNTKKVLTAKLLEICRLQEAK